MANKIFKTPFVGSIDQGTTSSRFIIFDHTGKIVTSHQSEFKQIKPEAGMTEHDPIEIYSTVSSCIESATEKLLALGYSVGDVKTVGITNQRETTVVWSKKTGNPLYNAVVWLDTRTKSTVKKLIAKTESKTASQFLGKVGLPLSTYFSAVKLNWLMEHVDAAANSGDLMFGTVDSWLLYKFTGLHITDVSNASRTMLMDLSTLKWDQGMCDFFDIPIECLPEIRSSSEVYGKISSGLLNGVSISGCLGDQQAALVGQRCLKPGQVKNTYGTGCFTLFNTGSIPITSKNGLLTTVAYKLGKDATPAYALEGSIAIAGAAITWLRDNLNMIKNSEEINEFAASVEDTAGVFFVPAFSGLFAPYWIDNAKGCIVGMTTYTTKHHICRATLEAICFQSKEIIDAMNSDSGVQLTTLKVDGGVTNSDICMQIQANTLGIRVERPAMRESTALGAALAAGLAVGVWTSLDGEEEGAFKIFEENTVFENLVGEVERDGRLVEWKKAVQKAIY